MGGQTACVTLAVIALAVVSACDRHPATLAFADGCYYVGKRPVFVVAAGEGRMLVSGQIHRFRVTAGGSMSTQAVFTPPFLFDGDTATRPFDEGVAAFAFPMVARTQTPTIRMNLVPYGTVDVVRGRPC